jgi:hypothetical protein
MDENEGEIFSVSPETGVIPPEETLTVTVKYRPHCTGMFSSENFEVRSLSTAWAAGRILQDGGRLDKHSAAWQAWAGLTGALLSQIRTPGGNTLAINCSGLAVGPDIHLSTISMNFGELPCSICSVRSSSSELGLQIYPNRPPLPVAL